VTAAVSRPSLTRVDSARGSSARRSEATAGSAGEPIVRRRRSRL
jgi:hypothetical protein